MFIEVALFTVIGMTMDEVALNAHAEATRYTRLMNVEVCGEIQHNGEGYVLDLHLSRDSHQCSIKLMPNGTRVLFHTHPANAPAKFAPSDYVLPGYLSHGRHGVFYQEGAGTERKVISTP